MAVRRRQVEAISSYETDFYGWTTRQAMLLRQGRLAEADIDNIAEEIEALGRSEKRELINRLAVLLTHLLKWQLQPGLRSNSWRLTIAEQRNELSEHLEENPSLRPSLDQGVPRAYKKAVLATQKETGLAESVFPATCPFIKAQLFDPAFLPE
jgi:Domain of unknown function DUF29